jgi:hypothetical protein
MVGIPRSQRLLAFESTTVLTSPAWVCPDGYVTLVKSAAAFNVSAAPVITQIVTRAAAENVAIPILYVDLASGATETYTGWLALNPGDVIYASLSAAGVRVAIYGAVLAGPPQFPPATRYFDDLGPIVVPLPTKRKGPEGPRVTKR